MEWLELSVQVPPEFVEPVSYLFGRYGNGLSMEKVENGEVLLRTYLTSTATQKRARIEIGVKLVGHLRPIKGLCVRKIEETNWQEAWKDQFTLLRVGRRLVIKPPWIPYEARDSELVLEIDPGLAFGTGHHPTTQMVLEELERLSPAGMSVLDVGTGSGVLSIAAVRLGAKRVTALDVDSTAVKMARSAIRANKVSDRVSLGRGSLPHSLAPAGEFHLALANISAKVISNLAPEILRCLGPGGILVVGGFLDKQEEQVTQRLSDVGFHIRSRHAMEDWVTLEAMKPAAG